MNRLKRIVTTKGDGGERQQIVTFTRWVNNKLKDSGLAPLEDITTDLDNGCHLVKLACVLFNLEVPKEYVDAPQDPTQGTSNIDLSLQLLKDANVVIPPTKSEVILSHNVKGILDLVWSAILHYLLKRIRELTYMAPMDESASEKTKSEDLKKILRDWLAELGASTKGFTEEWRDGMCILNVFRSYDVTLVPDYTSRTGEDATGNLNLALEVGARLGVPPLFAPEDVITSPVVDKRSILTYLSEVYCAVLSSKRSKETKKVDDANKKGRLLRQRIAEIEKRIGTVTAENEKLKKDIADLKTKRQNSVSDGVAETQELKAKIRALENENRSLGGPLYQQQQQQKSSQPSVPTAAGFRNFQLRSIGKADEEENKKLKSQLKTLENENKMLKSSSSGSGGAGPAGGAGAGKGRKVTNNIIENVDETFLVVVFVSSILAGFLPTFFFFILGTATFVLLADILIPKYTQALRNYVNPQQLSLAGYAILAGNVFIFVASLLFGGGGDDDDYYDEDEDYEDYDDYE